MTKEYKLHLYLYFFSKIDAIIAIKLKEKVKEEKSGEENQLELLMVSSGQPLRRSTQFIKCFILFNAHNLESHHKIVTPISQKIILTWDWPQTKVLAPTWPQEHTVHYRYQDLLIIGLLPTHILSQVHLGQTKMTLQVSLMWENSSGFKIDFFPVF